MTLGEMRCILRQSEIRLSKSLGQSFLHDANHLRRIIRSSNLHESDLILEIGPGLGSLTELLLERSQRVFAIEKDARLIEFLKRRFSQFSQSNALKLLHADALKYLREGDHDWRKWKLVSNLPYSVGTAILVELALNPKRPSCLIATLQLEVVRRIRATSDQRDYGILSLLLQVSYEAIDAFRIPSSCFFPRPEVDSACVILTRRSRPLLSGKALVCFVKLVKTGFGQRRKMMLKRLRKVWSEQCLKDAFDHAGISESVRAEAVSLKGFVNLAKAISENENAKFEV